MSQNALPQEKCDYSQPDSTFLIQAINELENLPYGTAATSEVVEAARDENLNVRRRAVCVLSLMDRSQTTVVAALVVALKDQDRFVRECAATSLYNLQNANRETIFALIQALKDKDVGVRANAAGALGSMGLSAKEAIPALKALRHQGGYAAPLTDEAIRKILEKANIKQQPQVVSSLILDANSDRYMTFPQIKGAHQ